MEDNLNSTADANSDDDFSLGIAGTIEVGILVCILLVGGPLNVLSFLKSLRAFRTHKAKSQILLLRINLNIADLITLFVYVPRQIIWMLTFQWYGGEVLCRVNSFFSTFSFYLNSFVIACIAIDRVYGAYNISSMNAHRRAYHRCRNLLSFGWAAAVLLSLPQVFVFRIVRPAPDFTQCSSYWEDVKHQLHMKPVPSEEAYEKILTQLKEISNLEQWYSGFHLLAVFWVPCVIIIISYLTVLLILQGHLRQDTSSTVLGCCFGVQAKSTEFPRQSTIDYQSPPVSSILPNEETAVILKIKEDGGFGESGARSVSLARQSRTPRLGAVAVTTIHKAKQHAKRQAAWIILAYLAFWSPYNLISVLNMVGEWKLPFPTSYFNALICANSIVNPIIYGVIKINQKRTP